MRYHVLDMAGMVWGGAHDADGLAYILNRLKVQPYVILAQ